MPFWINNNSLKGMEEISSQGNLLWPLTSHPKITHGLKLPVPSKRKLGDLRCTEPSDQSLGPVRNVIKTMLTVYVLAKLTRLSSKLSLNCH